MRKIFQTEPAKMQDKKKRKISIVDSNIHLPLPNEASTSYNVSIYCVQVMHHGWPTYSGVEWRRGELR